jgi:flagellar motility protein MotE (MotC chaperone)
MISERFKEKVNLVGLQDKVMKYLINATNCDFFREVPLSNLLKEGIIKPHQFNTLLSLYKKQLIMLSVKESSNSYEVVVSLTKNVEKILPEDVKLERIIAQKKRELEMREKQLESMRKEIENLEKECKLLKSKRIKSVAGIVSNKGE